jgi:hypothetical protein
LLAAITFAWRGPRGPSICSAKDKSRLPGHRRRYALCPNSRGAVFIALTPKCEFARIEPALSLFRRFFESGIVLRPALVFGRLGDPMRIILDFLRVWLSASSIQIVRQARLRLGFWRRGPLGHDVAPWFQRSALGARFKLFALAKPVQRSCPNSSRNFPLAPSRVCFRSLGRFRPARFM